MSASLCTTTIRRWYQANARPLPWRSEHTTPWGILLSEVMSQQTPVARVAPAWTSWINRWPTPAALAEAPKSEVLRAWGKLGYPRRALRLLECASMIVDKHGGDVPTTVAELLELPGIGDYTARAIAAFAFGQPVAVVDTNVRRVYHRAITGRFLSGNPRKRDLIDVEKLLPQHPPHAAAEFSAALMELGALVCTAQKPQCLQCPIKTQCAWQRLGCPQPSNAEIATAKKRVQKFTGTDRQVRGLILDVLRNTTHAVPKLEIDLVWADETQRNRALTSLLNDGLAEVTDDGLFRLPR